MPLAQLMALTRSSALSTNENLTAEFEAGPGKPTSTAEKLPETLEFYSRTWQDGGGAPRPLSLIIASLAPRRGERGSCSTSSSRDAT